MAPPAPGGPLYRIDRVETLRQAGTSRVRYRISCEVDHEAKGVPAHPWRCARPASRAAMPTEPTLSSPLLASVGITDRAMLERLRFRSPLLLALALEPLTQAREETSRAQQVRAAHVGRDRGIVNGTDQGHPARRDVVVEDEAGDPDAPGKRIRRARRVDTFDVLRRTSAINQRQHDAIELLREDIEAATAGIGGASQSEVHAAPWDRAVITARQMQAIKQVRSVMALVRPRDRQVLVWVLDGGTLMGFQRFARVGRLTAFASLRSALEAVADAYGIRGKS